MKTIRGDLIALGREGAFDVIVHGCNCHNTMGAGIARSIHAAFPSAYQVDQETAKGDRTKLGTITSASLQLEDRQLTVVNAYTQFHASGPNPLADYDAIRSAFRVIKMQFTGLRIGYPLIGAGLAGGDWTVISAIIDEELAGEDHTLVEFAG